MEPGGPQPEGKSGKGFPEAERELVGLVNHRVKGFEESGGKEHHERWNRFYRQYRGFKTFRASWVNGNKNDRDELLHQAKRDWGANLHIPLSFRTIETIVPKAISQAPRILVEARDEQWRHNVEGVRLLIDAQQDQIDIDLPLQAVMRSGRMYGLGASKAYWRREVTPRRRMQKRWIKKGYTVGKLESEVTFDDPMFEDIDIFDFGWDPYGSDMRTCEWAFHRVWMSTEAVMQRLQEGVWKTQSAGSLDNELLNGMGQGQKYDEVWAERLEASGLHAIGVGQGKQPHELIEMHDGQRVLTVLDREVLVQDGENQCCGMMPFQIYRPTALSKQLVGIGDLEPLEHLNRELDTLRSQRRDAATLALCAPLAFDSGIIDEDEITFGPGALLDVNGNPNDAIMQLQIRDIPGSSYQEEAAIRNDIEAVAGMADALNPQPGGSSQTATESMLVQASLSARIQMGARRFEIEVARQAGRAFLYLDQRMISEDRQALRVPEEGMTTQEAEESGRWKEYPVGPGELQGEYEIKIEGGSMATRNIPQDRSDAQALVNLFGRNPYLDPTKVLMRALELYGVRHPKSWLKNQEPPIPAMTLSVLKLAGVDPNLIEQALLKARTISAPQEGPSGQEVTAMLGGSPVAAAVGGGEQ